MEQNIPTELARWGLTVEIVRRLCAGCYPDMETGYTIKTPVSKARENYGCPRIHQVDHILAALQWRRSQGTSFEAAALKYRLPSTTLRHFHNTYAWEDEPATVAK